MTSITIQWGPLTRLGSSSSFLSQTHQPKFLKAKSLETTTRHFDENKKKMMMMMMRGREKGIVCGAVLGAVDPWAPTIDSASVASQFFAVSLFPYIGFLYFITKSKACPKLTLFGFYFLLTFVGATIPAGIYAKVHYGTSLANVDWLHGGAESLLTLTNLFIVMGLREALRKAKQDDSEAST